MIRVESLGRHFECTAIPYPWQLGIGVRIDVFAESDRVGSVHVLCSRDSSEHHGLASLSSSDLCALALARFATSELAVTLQSVLGWQKAIAGISHDGVSPLISGFSRCDPLRNHISYSGS